MVGRRTRGPPRRPDVLPAMVRRCTPLGRVRDRAGLDAPLVVRCPSPACRTGPGGCLAARARCVGRRVRCRADLVHGHAGRHRARGHARSRRRGAHQRRLPLRRRPGVAVDVVPDRQPPRRRARIAHVQGLLLLAPSVPGADAIDGDEHAELEALLACMSAGPVGIGDRVGRTDREVVMRTCDSDGRLRHVDRPLGLVDSCLFGEPPEANASPGPPPHRPVTARSGPTWSPSTPPPSDESSPTASNSHPSGSRARLRSTTGDTARVEPTDAIGTELEPRDWALWVCAPPGEHADAGELTKYVTVPSDLS